MTQPTGAAPAQVAEPAQPQAGTPTPQADPEPPTEPTPAPDATALQRELAEARREAARYRNEAKKQTDAQRSEEEATLSDLEKANRKIADLEREREDLLTRSQERAVRLATVDAAARLGFRSPEVAYKLIDRAVIEYEEDGSPKNIEKLLKDLLQREPYLGKASPAGDFGGGNRGPTPTTQPDMNVLLRRAARG
jgi:flagellar biosynthesis GTPase FlhF